MNNTDFHSIRPVESIIPYVKFDGNYLDILYHKSFPDILTWREKLFLKVLNSFALEDGEAYPRQKTLARKVGVKVRQLRNIINSLVEKGFLLVTKAKNLDKHIYRKSHWYHFLWHPVYDAVQKEIAGQIAGCTPYIENSSKSNTGKPGGDAVDKSKHHTPEQRQFYEQHLKYLCSRVSSKAASMGDDFNAEAFAFKHMKQYACDAVKAGIEGILEYLENLKPQDKLLRLWGIGKARINNFVAVNAPTASVEDILGDGYKPPPKLPDERRKREQQEKLSAVIHDLDRRLGIQW